MDLSKYELTEKEKRLVELPHPITLKYFKDEFNEYYIAKIPMLKGCMSDGKTVKEALENIIDAKVSWICTLLEHSENIPEPKNKVEIISILPPYTENEIEEMNKSYEKMVELIKETNEKYRNVVFLNLENDKR